jgi:hypothetical protein
MSCCVISCCAAALPVCLRGAWSWHCSWSAPRPSVCLAPPTAVPTLHRTRLRGSQRKAARWTPALPHPLADEDARSGQTSRAAIPAFDRMRRTFSAEDVNARDCRIDAYSTPVKEERRRCAHLNASTSRITRARNPAWRASTVSSHVLSAARPRFFFPSPLFPSLYL